jgi:hypothetical protein
VTARTTPQLYSKLLDFVMQYLPDQCDTRLTNLVLLLMGMYKGRSVHLSHIARKLPVATKMSSLVKRLTRLLQNQAVDVRAWYKPMAEVWLANAQHSGHIRLIIDTTKISGQFRLALVALAFARRAIPLGQGWSAGALGHTTAELQLELLRYIRTLLPHGVAVTLVGDGEFSSAAVVAQLQAWGWHYALRCACDTLIRTDTHSAWQQVDHAPLPHNKADFLPNMHVGKGQPVVTHVLRYWQRGEPRAWYLLTNLPTVQHTLKAYGLRMWIEELFGDLKGHGVDLEQSQLQHADRLARLTLAACLLYVWLMGMGAQVKALNQWQEIDRPRRHRDGDLSLFRWGWDYVERRIALQETIPAVEFAHICSV